MIAPCHSQTNVAMVDCMRHNQRGVLGGCFPLDGKALEELRLQGWPSRLCFRSNAAPNKAALLVSLLWQHRISGRIGTRMLCCPALHDLRTCTRWGSTLHHPPQSLHSVRLGAWKVWPCAFASGPLLPRLDHLPPEPVHGESGKHACCCGFPVKMLVNTMHVSPAIPGRFITGPFFVRRTA